MNPERPDENPDPPLPVSTAVDLRDPAAVFSPWAPASNRVPLRRALNRTEIIDLRTRYPSDPQQKQRSSVENVRKKWIRDFHPKTERCWWVGSTAWKRGILHGPFGAALTTTYWTADPGGRGRLAEELRSDAPKLRWTSEDENKSALLDGTSVLIESPGSAGNYYHWMLEALPRIWALRHLVADGRVDRIVVGHRLSMRFQQESLQTLLPDFPEDKLVFLNGVPTRFEKLAFFENFRGMTRTSDLSVQFVRDVRTLLPRLPGSERLYVQRGGSKRILREEPSLWDKLAKSGFAPVEGGDLSVGQQIGTFLGASHVLGVHGAGLTNAMFARPDAVLVELTSSSYLHRHTFSDLATALGMRTIVAILDEVGAYVNNHECPDVEFASDAARDQLLNAMG